MIIDYYTDRKNYISIFLSKTTNGLYVVELYRPSMQRKKLYFLVKRSAESAFNGMVSEAITTQMIFDAKVERYKFLLAVLAV